MIEIDGSYGEGGGQALRSALALSALTGRPARIRSIRAGRPKPGLAPQHLTAVLALAQICGARLHGAAEGSTEIEFHPRSRPRAGSYAFDVAETAKRGSAGSATLILQTLLLPLHFTGAASRVVLKGGTHVAWSPPFDYLADAFLRAVGQMGIRAELHLDAWGFYPAGGGQITAEIRGGDGTPSPRPLAPLALVERGDLKRVWGTAAATNLPSHVPARIAARARNVLAEAEIRAEIRTVRARSAGPGAGLFLTAEYGDVSVGFGALGERGKPSERVAEEACRNLLAHRDSGEPADGHLADQLLLPAALAAGRTEIRTSSVTQHLRTNAYVIERFLPARIAISGEDGRPGAVSVEGTAFNP